MPPAAAQQLTGHPGGLAVKVGPGVGEAGGGEGVEVGLGAQLQHDDVVGECAVVVVGVEDDLGYGEFFPVLRFLILYIDVLNFVSYLKFSMLYVSLLTAAIHLRGVCMVDWMDVLTSHILSHLCLIYISYLAFKI